MKSLFSFGLSLLVTTYSWAQEAKIIEIQKAGSSQQDQELFPGAT